MKRRWLVAKDEVRSVVQKMPQQLRMDTHHVLMHKDWFVDAQVNRCKC